MSGSINRISGSNYSSGLAWFNGPRTPSSVGSSSSSSSSAGSANEEYERPLQIPGSVQGEPVPVQPNPAMPEPPSYVAAPQNPAQGENPQELPIVHPAAPQHPPSSQTIPPSLFVSSVPRDNRPRILANPMARDPFNDALPTSILMESQQISEPSRPSTSSSSSVSANGSNPVTASQSSRTLQATHSSNVQNSVAPVIQQNSPQPGSLRPALAPNPVRTSRSLINFPSPVSSSTPTPLSNGRDLDALQTQLVRARQEQGGYEIEGRVASIRRTPTNFDAVMIHDSNGSEIEVIGQLAETVGQAALDAQGIPIFQQVIIDISGVPTQVRGCILVHRAGHPQAGQPQVDAQGRTRVRLLDRVLVWGTQQSLESAARKYNAELQNLVAVARRSNAVIAVTDVPVNPTQEEFDAIRVNNPALTLGASWQNAFRKNMAARQKITDLENEIARLQNRNSIIFHSFVSANSSNPVASSQSSARDQDGRNYRNQLDLIEIAARPIIPNFSRSPSQAVVTEPARSSHSSTSSSSSVSASRPTQQTDGRARATLQAMTNVIASRENGVAIAQHGSQLRLSLPPVLATEPDHSSHPFTNLHSPVSASRSLASMLGRMFEEFLSGNNAQPIAQELSPNLSQPPFASSSSSSAAPRSESSQPVPLEIDNNETGTPLQRVAVRILSELAVLEPQHKLLCMIGNTPTDVLRDPEVIRSLSDQSIRDLFNRYDSRNHLRCITRLDLSGLGLDVLPSEIFNLLTQLRELKLERNNLRSLPREIGKLTRLERLDLSHNQWTALPALMFSQLEQLTTLNLCANPLIFRLNNWFTLDRDSELGKEIARYQACMGYLCQSPLAILCKAILLNQDDEWIQSRFLGLSHAMQQKIRAEVQGDLFADRVCFVQAVLRAMSDKFAFSHKKEVYLQYAVLARQQNPDWRWGRDHSNENILRLIDAMEDKSIGNFDEVHSQFRSVRSDSEKRLHPSTSSSSTAPTMGSESSIHLEATVNRDGRAYAAIQLLCRHQGSLSKERVNQASNEFIRYLYTPAASDGQQRRLARGSFSIGVPVGKVFTDERFALQDGSRLTGRELIGRLWIFASQLNGQEAINAKDAMISALADSYGECNGAKAQRLISAVLQGRLAGVDVEAAVIPQ